MPGAEEPIAKLTFDALTRPKELHEIGGGHFGLLEHPGPVFEQVSAIQAQFLVQSISPSRSFRIAIVKVAWGIFAAGVWTLLASLRRAVLLVLLRRLADLVIGYLRTEGSLESLDEQGLGGTRPGTNPRFSVLRARVIRIPIAGRDKWEQGARESA